MPRQTNIKENVQKAPSQQETYRYTENIRPAAQPVNIFQQIQARQVGGQEWIDALGKASQAAFDIAEVYHKSEVEKGYMAGQEGKGLPEGSNNSFEQGYYYGQGKKKAIEFNTAVNLYHQNNMNRPMDEYDKGLQDLYNSYAQGQNEFFMKGFYDNAQATMGNAQAKQRGIWAQATRSDFLSGVSADTTDMWKNFYTEENLQNRMDQWQAAGEIAGLTKKQVSNTILNTVVEQAEAAGGQSSIDRLKQLKDIKRNGIAIKDMTDVDSEGNVVVWGAKIDKAIETIHNNEYNEDERAEKQRVLDGKEFKSNFSQTIIDLDNNKDLTNAERAEGYRALRTELRKNARLFSLAEIKQMETELNTRIMYGSEGPGDEDAAADYVRRIQDSDAENDPILQDIENDQRLNMRQKDTLKKMQQDLFSQDGLMKRPGYKQTYNRIISQVDMIPQSMLEKLLKDIDPKYQGYGREGLKQLLIDRLNEAVIEHRPDTIEEFEKIGDMVYDTTFKAALERTKAIETKVPDELNKPGNEAKKAAFLLRNRVEAYKSTIDAGFNKGYNYTFSERLSIAKQVFNDPNMTPGRLKGVEERLKAEKIKAISDSLKEETAVKTETAAKAITSAAKSENRELTSDEKDRLFRLQHGMERPNAYKIADVVKDVVRSAKENLEKSRNVEQPPLSETEQFKHAQGRLRQVKEWLIKNNLGTDTMLERWDREIQAYEEEMAAKLEAEETTAPAAPIESKDEFLAIRPAEELPKPTAKGDYNLDEIINDAGSHYGVDPNLIRAVIEYESSFNPNTIGPVIPAGKYKGQTAKGLMQLLDDVAKEKGVNNVFNPVENINAGTLHLKERLDMFNGDVEAALIAYHAGQDNAKLFLDAGRDYSVLPQPEKTKPYVQAILRRIRK